MSSEKEVLQKRVVEIETEIKKLVDQLNVKGKELDAFVAEKQKEVDRGINERKAELNILQQNYIAALGAVGELKNIILILEEGEKQK